MPRKLPQKPDDQDNSRIARRNLEDYFGKWNISRLDDDSSGTEYGQDWMVGIVSSSGDVTGMEFRVQSKVLRGKKAIQGDYICDQLSVTTINYLYDLSVPVLFHFFHKPTNQGYVMWLDTWYIQNRKDKWEQQGQVTVKIPLSSKLDEQMVDLLSKYVWEKHHKHGLRKTVDLINETSSDYKVKIDFVENDTWVVVAAKHDDAIPTITPLDSEAEAALQKALELGIPLPITGKFGITNIPSILIGEMELVQLSIIPRLMDLPIFPIRVQYFDENDQIVYETKYVDMTPIQHGSVIKKWQGNALSDALKYVIEHNAANQAYSFSFGLRDGEKNPTQITRFFDAIKKISQAKRCRVLDPRTDNVFIDSTLIPDFQVSNQTKAIEALSRALDTIQSFAGKLIEMPSTFSGDDIMSAEGVADVLKTGVYAQLLDGTFPREDFVLILTGTKEWANHVANSINGDAEPASYTHEGPAEVHATVLGHEINLGSCEYVFEDLQLLKKHSESEDEVQLVFTFRREKAFTRFLQWYKEP
jgi:hypothetical protein